MHIGYDLLEAYRGYYEDDHFSDDVLEQKIKKHSPKERLAIYMEWNGILGFTNRIFELANGEL